MASYDAFKGPWPSREVTSQSVANMAARRLTGDERVDSNILLARELVRRPELMQAFDRRGTTGEMDNRLSMADIERFVNSSNPLKLATDKDIVMDVLKHFNTLKGGFWNRSIDLSTFEKLATQPWTGDPKRDHLIQLSREVLERSDLRGLMDSIFGSQRDGRATRNELKNLLKLLG